MQRWIEEKGGIYFDGWGFFLGNVVCSVVYVVGSVGLLMRWENLMGVCCLEKIKVFKVFPSTRKAFRCWVKRTVFFFFKTQNKKQELRCTSCCLDHESSIASG